MPRADTVQITPEILSLIARIDEFKGARRALGTLVPDRLSALRRVATIESIGSSTRIGGSKLSEREVEQLLSNLEIKSYATRDEQEVAGHAELTDLVFSSWQDITFTETHVKQLHQILLRHSEKETGIAATTRPARTSSPRSTKPPHRSASCFRPRHPSIRSA